MEDVDPEAREVIKKSRTLQQKDWSTSDWHQL